MLTFDKSLPMEILERMMDSSDVEVVCGVPKNMIPLVAPTISSNASLPRLEKALLRAHFTTKPPRL